MVKRPKTNVMHGLFTLARRSKTPKHIVEGYMIGQKGKGAICQVNNCQNQPFKNNYIRQKWTEQTHPTIFLKQNLPIRFYFQYQKSTVLHYDSKHLYSAGRKIKCKTAVLKFRYPEYTERKGICSIYNI